MSKETEKKLPVEQPRLVLRRGAIKAVARELCRQKRIDPDAMEPGQVRGKSDVTLSNGDPANAMWKYHTEEAKRIIDVMLEYLPQNAAPTRPALPDGGGSPPQT
jgi:hypothetical protein